MGSDAPQRLGDLLDGIGARLGLARSADARTVWGRWGEIVGDGVSEHAEPSSLRDGVLRVRTDSPAWA
ncbi:MAG: DciA family protein, partial [Actinomycetota bacterium]